MSLPASGTIVVRKVNENNDWVEDVLEANDLIISTSGSPWVEANVSGTNVEDILRDLATELNTKSNLTTTGSVFYYNTTTNSNTETTLGTLNLAPDVALKFTAEISAWNGVDDKFYGSSIAGVVYRDGAGAALADGVYKWEFGESSGYSSDIKTSGNDLELTVSGLSGETITWQGKLSFVTDNLIEERILFEGTRPNNTNPLTFKNAADTQNLEVLNVDSSDRTVLSGNTIIIDSNGDLILKSNTTDRWSVNTAGHFVPSTNNLYDLGTNSSRIRATYSNSYLPFTGEHVYKLSTVNVPSIGDAVCLNDNHELIPCDMPQEASCVGILAKDNLIVTPGLGMYDSMGNLYITPGTVLGSVAACGDVVTGTLNGMKVCNEGGNITKGDLLCSSSVPGHLMKQSVTSLHNFTVAKCLQNVTFSGSTTASGVYGYLLL